MVSDAASLSPRRPRWRRCAATAAMDRFFAARRIGRTRPAAAVTPRRHIHIQIRGRRQLLQPAQPRRRRIPEPALDGPVCGLVARRAPVGGQRGGRERRGVGVEVQHAEQGRGLGGRVVERRGQVDVCVAEALLGRAGRCVEGLVGAEAVRIWGWGEFVSYLVKSRRNEMWLVCMFMFCDDGDDVNR